MKISPIVSGILLGLVIAIAILAATACTRMDDGQQAHRICRTS